MLNALLCTFSKYNLYNYFYLYHIFTADIDECTNSTFLCDSNAECNNTEGSYLCTCLYGYTGNGTYCEGSKSLHQTVFYEVPLVPKFAKALEKHL